MTQCTFIDNTGGQNLFYRSAGNFVVENSLIQGTLSTSRATIRNPTAPTTDVTVFHFLSCRVLITRGEAVKNDSCARIRCRFSSLIFLFFANFFVFFNDSGSFVAF
jgi:hypothetical protein